MKSTAKVIETLKKYGRVTVGTTATREPDGVQYRYDLYNIAEPFGWLINEFSKAAEENGVKYMRQFRNGAHSVHFERAQYIGQPHGSMQLSELVIVDG